MARADMLQVVVLFSILACVTNISWTSKDKRRDFYVNTIDYSIDAPEREPCEDTLPRCLQLYSMCNYHIIVRKRCKVTCGTCSKGYTQIDCHNRTLSPWGCCWDNTTVAKGPNFEGCAPCRDKYAECKYFRGRCGGENNRALRLKCPVSCNVGCEKKQCLDDKHQVFVCKLYRKHGFCHKSPRLMKKVCSKTCGFC